MVQTIRVNMSHGMRAVNALCRHVPKNTLQGGGGVVN